MRLNLHRGAALGLALALTVLAAPIASAGVTAPPSPSTPPTVAQDDPWYAATEDEALVVAAAEGVLANDPPGACVLGTDTTGLSGDITMTADGAFTYTPATNFNGTTSFVYRIADVGPCLDQVANSQATVTITVASVNDAPTATPDSFIVLKDRTLNVRAPGVLLNDHDVDVGDSLTAVKVTNAAHGVVTLAADGEFSYTPGVGYTGPDAFSYKASDGTASSLPVVVSLTVTAVPPVPTPTPAPTPTPTAAPTATPEVTNEPSPSSEPSPSLEPSPSAAATLAPFATPSATPSPSAAPGPAPEGGGIPLPVLLVLVLFVLLIGFGAALYGPRWLAARRGEPIDDDDGL